MAGEGVQGLSRLGIPEADGRVKRCGGEQATIRRPGHAKDRTSMAGESEQELGRLGIPEADGRITRCGGE